MSIAFRVDQNDNVATLLGDARAGRLSVHGEGGCELTLHEAVPGAHKVAVTFIPKNGVILKFGWPIGHATCDIRQGEWVHLHNMASNYDTRSGTLDLHTGSPTDTLNAYV